jgi:uncharacterized protein (TIGR03000 family)
MRKLLFSVVLGAAALLGLPALSFAQHGGGHGGGGGHSGGGGGHASFSHSGGVSHGGGFNHSGGFNRGYGYGYGRGFYGSSLYLGYPGYYSPYYGSSYYYGPDYSYVAPNYTYVAPTYTYVQPASGYVQPAIATPAYYPPDTTPTNPDPNANPNAVALEVKVPENAELWVDGTKTTQTSDLRHFVSPPVDPGKTYTYTLRARWTDPSGKVIDRTKKIDVKAGARLGVDFNNP